MVKVRDDQPVHEDGSVDLDRWLEILSNRYTFEDEARFRQACELVEASLNEESTTHDVWSLGQNAYLTGLEMVQILVDLQQTEEALIAGVLYRAVREERLSIDRVKAKFGAEIARLLRGVLQMAAIGSRKNPRDEEGVLGSGGSQVDNVRKMLVAMVDDVRVALIKLAERTCAIRAVKEADRRKRYIVAREVFDIYAPLAHRLGIGHIKWELEDLSFRYLKPNDYKHIAKLLAEKRLARQEYIDSVIKLLEEKLVEVGIEGHVSGRAKHIYSIWRKMQRKNIEFNQVYDVRALRILVPEIRDCYTVLGIVHGSWRNIPHEFDDYIASPKPNGYRSLHTAVFGPESQAVEIQIRTFDMHEEAELGVCAHHLYKGTDTASRADGYEEKISWLRQVLEWHDELGDTESLSDILHSDVTQDRVYVFTPEGHVIDLPAGATPVDFAYRVHTEIGHRCRGARVSGRIVPLNRALQTGDQVEIMTGPDERPSRDWLNTNLGYVKTSKGRAKIAHWFKTQARDQNVDAGKEMIQREFKRLALDATEVDLSEIAQRLKFTSNDNMFAALGAGDLRISQVISAAQAREEQAERESQLDLDVPASLPKQNRSSDSGVHVVGVGSLMTLFASCCKPIHGDAIAGFVTQGRGVSIHREDCKELQHLRELEPSKIVQVAWEEEAEATYPVDIVIEAFDRSGLLRDVMTILANERINILSANTLTDKSSNEANLALTLEIGRLDKLGKVMDKINQIPNVSDVRRERSGVH
ncbi:MAG: GTP diphosphokinase [Marinobacterium sp.]